jgi:hypothetical protein
MRTQKLYCPDFYFLGKRKYVQGATLIDGLIEATEFWNLGEVQTIKMNCRLLLREQGVFTLLKENVESDEKKNFHTVFNISCNGTQFTVGLNPTNDSIETSVAYDEAASIAGFKIDKNNQSISLAWTSKLHPMQIFIALFKKILSELNPGIELGRWIFFGVDLNYALIKQIPKGQLVLKIKTVIANRNAKASLSIDGNDFGQIYFTRAFL